MRRLKLHLPLLLVAALALAVASCRRSFLPPAPGPSGSTPAPGAVPARTMYARCNLKVLKNRQVTWVNWQSSPTFIPVGTRLEVSGGPRLWSLTNDAGTAFTLDTGASGDPYLLKFVSVHRIALEDFPESVRTNIANAVARVGMTREQVYVAMGPPANADAANTNLMTREQIMASLLWVYRRRTFGKNIGVRFDPNGIVVDTEGIWR